MGVGRWMGVFRLGLKMLGWDGMVWYGMGSKGQLGEMDGVWFAFLFYPAGM